MRVPRAGRRWVAICLVAALALTAWLVHSTRRPVTPRPQLVSGANRLAGVVARDSIKSALTQLAWEDIAATAEGTGARAGLRREVVEASAGDPRHETRYLRGLLLIAEQRPEEALAAFDSIPVDRIPAGHLYAPYRLQGALRPGMANPYRAPLVAARRAGRLPPLVGARVAVAEGDFRAAVRGYVSSDPAQWASHDLTAFRALLLHAGVSPDTRTMLAAATRGGRVPARLRADITELLSASGRVALPEQLKAALVRLLTENPAAREVAMAAATAQRRARGLFVARQYAVLVDEYRSSDPTSLPDGTLVVLLLSAGRSGEADLRDLWAQELRRRYPGPELERWLSDVKPNRS